MMSKSCLWLLAVLFAVAQALSLAHADEYTTPNTGVCWDMDSLVVHSGGIVSGQSPEYTFHGSVIISSLDTLMVSAGSVLIFDASRGSFELEVKGNLFAQGTADEVIDFTCTQQSPGAWEGITLKGLLEYCRVEYASWGVILGSSASVTHSTITENHRGVVLVGPTGSGRSAVISDNLIADNESCGILWEGLLDLNQAGGREDEPLIEGNEIRDNGSFGISLAWGTKAIIRANLISGNGTGIYCGPYDASVVVENTIKGNDVGVVCDNMFTTEVPNLGDLGNQSSDDDGGNHISDNLEYDFYHASDESIKTEGNYWGTTDLNIIDSHIYDDEEDVGDADGNGIVSGPVDFVPIGGTSVQRSTWGRIKAQFR